MAKKVKKIKANRNVKKGDKEGIPSFCWLTLRSDVNDTVRVVKNY